MAPSATSDVPQKLLNEPVLEREKEHRHWLESPLFVRGLPLQLPADHALMHPFFGIQGAAAGVSAASLPWL